MICFIYNYFQTLQTQFIGLLDNLGVKADVIKYMRYLGINKERREYLTWMFKIMNEIKHQTR